MQKDIKSYEFGDFRLDLINKSLKKNGAQIPLTPKIFETLLVLVEGSGRLIEKEELMERVWHDRFVEDSNITFNIKMLRKALGDSASDPKYIETITRRGYRFIPEVKKELAEEAIAAAGLPPAKAATARYSLFLIATIAAIMLLLGFIYLGNRAPDAAKNAPSMEALTRTGKIKYAVISADGKLMAYVSRNNDKESLWTRNLAENSNQQILELDSGTFNGLRFSSDNNIYYVKAGSGSPASIFRIPFSGGNPEKIIEDTLKEFSLSPNGRKISYSKKLDEKQLALMLRNLDSGEDKILKSFAKPKKIEAIEWLPDNENILFSFGETDSGQQDIEILEINSSSGESKTAMGEKWFQVKSIAFLNSRNSFILLGRKKLSEQNQLWEVSYKSGAAEKFASDTSNYIEVTASSDGDKIMAIQSINQYHLYVADLENLVNAKRIAKAYRGLSWVSDDKLIYASNINGNDDIWSISADGAGGAQLTSDESTDFLPRFSPADKSIYFVSDSDGVNHIWKMKEDGSGRERLTDSDGGICPAISPDGKSLAYFTNDKRLWKLPANSREKQPLTDIKGFRPEFSPSGEMVAFAVNAEAGGQAKIAIVNLRDGKLVKEFEIKDRGLSSWRILWKKDGNTIYYASLGQSSISNIWAQPIDGSAPSKISDFSETQVFDFDISPDGKRMAFIRGGWDQDAVLIKGF